MAAQPGKKKFKIKFFDGCEERFFELLEEDRDTAIAVMKNILQEDGFVPNNQAKILTFIEEEI